MSRYVRIALLMVIGLLLAVHAQAAEWGDLSGRFLYNGKAPAPKPLKITKDQAICDHHGLVDESLIVGSQGELANVFVYVRTPKPAVHPDYAKTANAEVVLDNLNCRFAPHALVLRTTQPLVIKNSDATGHNTNLGSLKNEFNQIIPTNDKFVTHCKIEEKTPVPVRCNVHEWMKGYMLVRSNPYMAVTDTDGRFTIEKLPAGSELEFQLWHETCGFVKGSGVKGQKVDKRGRLKFTIKPGKNDWGNIRVDGAVLASRS